MDLEQIKSFFEVVSIIKWDKVKNWSLGLKSRNNRYQSLSRSRIKIKVSVKLGVDDRTAAVFVTTDHKLIDATTVHVNLDLSDPD